MIKISRLNDAVSRVNADIKNRLIIGRFRSFESRKRSFPTVF